MESNDITKINLEKLLIWAKKGQNASVNIMRLEGEIASQLKLFEQAVAKAFASQLAGIAVSETVLKNEVKDNNLPETPHCSNDKILIPERITTEKTMGSNKGGIIIAVEHSLGPKGKRSTLIIPDIYLPELPRCKNTYYPEVNKHYRLENEQLWCVCNHTNSLPNQTKLITHWKEKHHSKIIDQQ